MANKRWLLTGVAMSVLLSACGSGDATTSKDATNSDGAAAEKPEAVAKDWTNESFKVVFYANNMQTKEEIDFWFGDPLRKKFSNIQFEYIQATAGNKIEDVVATGRQIDVFFTPRGNYESTVYAYDIQYDMTELVKTHQVDLSRIEPILLEEVKRTSDGKLYMLPVQNNIQLLFYNKDIFDRFGVPYPKDGMTWNEMLALANRITRKDGDKLYFGFSNQGGVQVAKMNPMSLTKIDPQTNQLLINKDERWKKLYEMFFVQPYHNNAVFQEFFATSNTPPGLNHFYKDQSVAMLTYIASLLGQQYMDMYLGDLNWDMVAHPTLEDYPGLGTQPDPIYIGMTKLTKDKDATMEVIKYLISDEYQTMMARQANMTVLSDPNIQKQTGADIKRSGVGKNWNALYYNKMAPMTYMNPKYDLLINTTLTTYANQLAKGTIDLNTMLRTAEEDIQKQIEALEKR